jgi:hypothetical protein
MGLLRRLHGILQRGVDLESGRLFGRRAHHRCANASAYADTNSGAYARADASTDPSTNAGAYAGTDGGYYGTDAGTHLDVQL